MKNIALYIDMAFCLVLLPLMIYAFPVERWLGMHPMFFGSFIGWLYATYFLYKYFIIPRLFKSGTQRMAAIAAIVFSLSVTFLLSTYEINSPLYHLRMKQLALYPYPIWGVRQNQQAVWLHYIIVVIFCFAVGMLNEAYIQRMARKEVEYERNKAELALYKAQINPHFLFNTLNTIYGLLITHSDKTETTLEQFINLTKYMYNNAGRDYISLEEEVEYIRQYIALQELRLNEFADIRFLHEVEDEAMQVPPMMLITFVENAFKYGISSNEPCFIHIRMEQHGGTLEFEVTNSAFGHSAKHSGRIGIENCRRRLALLYHDRHHLHTGHTDEGTFKVHLELKSINS
ncbi:MAG: histidine kinase [Bacteroidales bacterium]|nr:histidine kinase [Bacteroidales bacterium]MCM1146348.1 histidine kinase [Bacteroidales bacterium]MCM1205214.1 histidine kinase [Bacillota bacterium]MCM1509701.1 histidine kinase [Clostridium sp.]